MQRSQRPARDSTRPHACPECGSSRLWRAGRRYTWKGTIQRWLCRDCGYRFSESSLKSNRPRHESMVHTTSLKMQEQTIYCQVGARKSRAKNLAPGLNPGRGKGAMQQQTHQKSQKAELKGKIVEFLWWMRKQGYAEQTIHSRGKRLRRLVRLGANLLEPESVKEVLARQKNWSKGYKETFVITYDLFAKWLGLQWDRPKCKRGEVLPWVPTEREIDQLIAGVNKRFAAYIQLLKETGMRAGEAFKLRWDQIDFETRTIRVVPEKGSNPRIFKVSNKLLGMIQALPKRGEKVFCQSSNYKNFYKEFCHQRNKVARKLNNPRIKKISFLSLRHFKGTYEYHRTRDILHVMKILGHKNIKNTMVYIQLEQAIFKEDAEYVCRVARTVKEAKNLIEAGFEFVCEIDGAKLFRKPK